MKRFIDKMAQWLRGKEKKISGPIPPETPKIPYGSGKEELENAIKATRELQERAQRAKESGSWLDAQRFAQEFTLEFRFQNRQETDIDKINEALAKHALSSVEVQDHAAYLTTEKRFCADTQETSVRRWLGLDKCVLRCRRAQPGKNFTYQISTMAIDKSEKDAALVWRNAHPGQMMRCMIQIEYEDAYGLIVLYHEKLTQSEVPRPVAAAKKQMDPCHVPPANPSNTCGERLTWRLEEGTLFIRGKGEIKEEAFASNSAIKKVVIAPGCTCIGFGAFFGCKELQSVELPNTIMEIRGRAFEGCKRLKAVDLPRSVKKIGYKVFKDCENLTSIKIPDRMIVIAKELFSGCSRLERVEIPESIKSIRDHAFYQCSALKRIRIPESVDYMGLGVFEKCSALETVTIPGSVLTLKSSMFSQCTALKGVTLENGIRKIAYGVFSYCTQLENVYIPASVDKIENGAFWRMDLRTAIHVDRDNPCYTVENERLMNRKNGTLIRCCKEIEGKYDIPSGVKGIGEMAFDGQKKMTAVQIPDSVRTIGEYAFRNTGLMEADIPESVYLLGEFAFFGCENLVRANIPGSVKVLRDGTFAACPALTTAVIGEGIAEIGRDVFGGVFGANDQMTSIDLPASLQKISSYAFRETACLREIRMPIANKAENACFICEDGVLFSADMRRLILCPEGKVGKYSIPAGVTEIEERAFQRCRRLTEILIPEGVAQIGIWAFSGCTALTTLTIPDSVTTIGDDAFAGVEHIRASVPGPQRWGAKRKN